MVCLERFELSTYGVSDRYSDLTELQALNGASER